MGLLTVGKVSGAIISEGLYKLLAAVLTHILAVFKSNTCSQKMKNFVSVCSLVIDSYWTSNSLL